VVRSLVTLKVRSDARESTRLYGLQFELIPFSSIGYPTIAVWPFERCVTDVARPASSDAILTVPARPASYFSPRI